MPAPLRLVFCITELDSGGAERALTQLVTNLHRDEWDPHVICLGPRGYFTDVLEEANVPVICLNGRGIASVPRVLYQLTRELLRIRPAVVQTFLFHANILGRIAARLAGVPHVASGLRVAERRSRWYGRIDRWTNSLVDTNICVSQGVADFSVSVTGLSSKKLIVIPNAVDVDRFAQASAADLTGFGIPAGCRVLITIGRLEPQKGIDVLLDAIGMVCPGSTAKSASMGTLPDDVHFLIVGDGFDERILKEQAQRLQINDRVHFAGRREEIPELLRASTALVLPSRWEGMPNVVLEAMAAARPVIASRVEGVAELVQDGITGFVIPPERPDELAKAVLNLLENNHLLNAYGERAQQVVGGRFSIQAVTQSYSRIYLNMIQSAP